MLLEEWSKGRRISWEVT